jgi:hypothetical protein
MDIWSVIVSVETLDDVLVLVAAAVDIMNE